MSIDDAAMYLSLIDGRTVLEHRLSAEPNCRVVGHEWKGTLGDYRSVVREGDFRDIIVTNPPNKTVLREICSLTGSQYIEEEPNRVRITMAVPLETLVLHQAVTDEEETETLVVKSPDDTTFMVVEFRMKQGVANSPLEVVQAIGRAVTQWATDAWVSRTTQSSLRSRSSLSIRELFDEGPPDDLWEGIGLKPYLEEQGFLGGRTLATGVGDGCVMDWDEELWNADIVPFEGPVSGRTGGGLAK